MTRSNTITADRLGSLAAQLRLHGELLAHPDLQHAIGTHWNDLRPGIKAAQSDADGSRSADRTSQPEAAASSQGDAGARAADAIAEQIAELEKALDRLLDLEREATRKREPIPTQCPSCTSGKVPVGYVRCDNLDCLTHVDTRPTCEIEGCDQVLVKGATGKTKPHKLPDGTPVCGRCAKQAKRKGWHTIDDYQLTADVVVEDVA